MTKNIFLEKLKSNTNSQIVHLCMEHMLNKVYKNDEIIDEIQLKEFLSNYKNYHRYLNDFAGTIYNRYGSHINTIYIDVCEYLNIEVDNKYTLEYTIIKLEKQTPELLLGLTNEDIQNQTIEHFDEKLEAIEDSVYYKKNKNEFFNRVEKLYKNINLVKNALSLKK